MGEESPPTKLGEGRVQAWGSKKRLGGRKRVQAGSSPLRGARFQGERWEREFNDLFAVH